MLADGKQTPVAAAVRGHDRGEQESCPRTGLLDHSRRHRTAFTREQLAQLETEYCRESYVSRTRRCELATALNLPETTIKVWFQNRRMKDKRQRHVLPWSHPLVDPLGVLLMSHASPASPLQYPFLPCPLPHHLPLHLYSPLGYPSISVPAHGPYSAPVRPVGALRFSQYQSQPPAGALYPAGSILHHPVSCPCPLCLSWGPEHLLKAQRETAGLGLSRAHSPEGSVVPTSLEHREEVV